MAGENDGAPGTMSTTGDPIVPIPSFEELSPAFQARARRGRERLGANVNSLHAFAHSEELGGVTRNYFEAVAKLTVLPNELRLLIRLAVATANRRYCTAHQRHQLASLAVPEEKMAAIWKLDTGELTPRERAAVRFGQAITLDAGGIRRCLFRLHSRIHAAGADRGGDRRNLDGHAQQTHQCAARAARIRVRGTGGVILLASG